MYFQLTGGPDSFLMTGCEFAMLEHKFCAMRYIVRMFQEDTVMTLQELVRIYRLPDQTGKRPCFSDDDLQSAWNFLVRQHLVREIEIKEWSDGARTLYVCPHLGVGADFKHRKHLCINCRRQFRGYRPADYDP